MVKIDLALELLFLYGHFASETKPYLQSVFLLAGFVDDCLVGVFVTVCLSLVLCLSYKLAAGIPLFTVPKHRNYVPSVYYHLHCIPHRTWEALKINLS